MLVAVTFCCCHIVFSINFGFAGNLWASLGALWTLAVLLVVVVLGNEFYPRFCSTFIQRADNLGFHSKLALSGFSIALGTIYPFLAVLICQSFDLKVGEKTLYAALTVPIAGFAPLLAFGMLRESRLHRYLRGDHGITNKNLTTNRI